MGYPAGGLLAKGVAVVLAAGPTATLADDPSTPVREAYRLEKLHLTSRSAKPPWQAPHRDKLFSRRFAQLWATDERYGEVTHEIGNLDVDPFIVGQDYQDDVLHDLVIDVVKQKGTWAEVRARLTNFRPVTVQFVVIRENGRWLIDDMLSTEEGVVYSVSKSLAQPYVCSEAWKERCEHPRP